MISIRPLAARDLAQVAAFAGTGMHFDRYFHHAFTTAAFSRFFVEREYAAATLALGAYDGTALAGVLMARGQGPQSYASWWRRGAVATGNALMQLAAAQATPAYDAANAAMLAQFTAKKSTDGEISLLATDPKRQGQGIGSQLVAALAKRAAGQRYFLFTDSDCGYGFYDRRGFTRELTRDITLTLNHQDFPLTCMLYSKVF